MNKLFNAYAKMYSTLYYPNSNEFNTMLQFPLKNALCNAVRNVFVSYSSKTTNMVCKYVPENIYGYEFPVYGIKDDKNYYLYYSATGIVEIYNISTLEKANENTRHIVLSQNAFNIMKDKAREIIYNTPQSEKQKGLKTLNTTDIETILFLDKGFKRINPEDISKLSNITLKSCYVSKDEFSQLFEKELEFDEEEDIEL